MRADDVTEVLDRLDRAGVRHWVGGGWGVAALAGRQTREHRDLDLAIDAEDLDTCLRVLSQLGYAAETDWLPVRIELRAPGHAGSTCIRWTSARTVTAVNRTWTAATSTIRRPLSPPGQSATARSTAYPRSSSAGFAPGMSIARKTSMISPNSMLSKTDTSHRHDKCRCSTRSACATATHSCPRPAARPVTCAVRPVPATSLSCQLLKVSAETVNPRCVRTRRARAARSRATRDPAERGVRALPPALPDRSRPMRRLSLCLPLPLGSRRLAPRSGHRRARGAQWPERRA